jgi:hypothetical protein
MAFDPISLALEIGGKVLDRVFPDPTERAKAQLELLKLEQSGDLAVMTAQTDINKVEASNTNLFVSGWRPFVGWVCGIALLYAAIIEPLARFVAQVIFKYAGAFPFIDTTQVVISRIYRGKSPFQGGRDHVSHLLLNKGLSENKVVITIWSFGIFFAAIAIYLSKSI